MEKKQLILPIIAIIIGLILGVILTLVVTDHVSKKQQNISQEETKKETVNNAEQESVKQDSEELTEEIQSTSDNGTQEDTNNTEDTVDEDESKEDNNEDSSSTNSNTNKNENAQSNNHQKEETKPQANTSNQQQNIVSTQPSSNSTSNTSQGETIATWDAGAVYVGGDKVTYKNKIYKAKWWTQGETPGQADVWEDTGETNSVSTPPNTEPETAPQTSTNNNGGAVSNSGFKVVGYYPSWKPQQKHKLQYDVLIHIIYFFAIPTAEGGLRPLENADTAKQIIQEAHNAGRKVLLAIGGWSYNDTPLENVFVSATSTEEKRNAFVSAILTMCDQYGFDGIDMDWEHPRVDGTSGKQYEAVMLSLANELHNRGKILTTAVLSGATADGNIYYDAKAHSDAVLQAVDWIHVMAYDGGEGSRHSSYEFAVNSAKYWKETRGLPASKVVLGVPFYARPSWASYEDLLASNQNAWSKDTITYNGMEVWYNGVDTIRKKTRYSLQNLGGVMIWELTQDTVRGEHSLLTNIGKEIAGK